MSEVPETGRRVAQDAWEAVGEMREADEPNHDEESERFASEPAGELFQEIPDAEGARRPETGVNPM